MAGGSAELRDRLKRSAYLRHFLEVYHSEDDDKPHHAPAWEAWLRQTGELPPDFEALPTQASLPELLKFNDGRPVPTPEAWQQRRQEILRILHHYQLGDWPPPPPKMLVEELGASLDEELGGTLRHMFLTYGPSEKAVTAETLVPHRDEDMFRVVSLNVDVFIPQGDGPFPAVVELGGRRGGRLMTAQGARAARRGYVVCSFDRLDAFLARDVYPDYDANQLVWWAYAASRCVDHLLQLEQVDQSKIAVMGHSRSGKMAMTAAVLDQRFAATIASHPGAGSGQAAPWRYLGEKFGGETLESSTLSFPYWNHPRLRFFAGRENKLPFDSHFMMALVAPRALLIGQGDADDVGECWGAQQAYLATKEVYALLGRLERLHIVFHAGGHRLSDDALEGYIDWLDMQFGRRPLDVPEKLMYTYSFDRWREVTGQAVEPLDYPERGLDHLLTAENGAAIDTSGAWDHQRTAIRQQVMWGLGKLPSLDQGRKPKLSSVSRVAKDPGLSKAQLDLGGNLVAHLTYPSAADGKLPVVIYLHAYVDALGSASTSEYGWSPLVQDRLAQHGFLAVTYDQFGYGARNRDAGIEFFTQHPEQSVLGVMIQDVRRVIDGVSALELADHHAIMVAGFSLGGLVGLYAAALDERIRALATTCGFGSMRRDAHGQETEGLRRYTHLRPLLPRLGFFVGQERRLPYDLHQVLALIAPRPVLVLAPRLDQDWHFEDVVACCEAARGVYALLGAEDHLHLHTPLDFNRYPPAYQTVVNDWLWQVARGPRAD